MVGMVGYTYQVLAGLSDVQVKFMNSAGPEERDRLLLQVSLALREKSATLRHDVFLFFGIRRHGKKVPACDFSQSFFFNESQELATRVQRVLRLSSFPVLLL